MTVTPRKIWVKFGTPHRNGEHAHSNKKGVVSYLRSYSAVLTRRELTSTKLL